MALQFPTSPVDGQQVTLNGKVWRYDATQGVWSVPTVSSTQSVALARTELTATAGQTVLNVTYNTSYGVDVSINGLQMLSSDFTATDGSTIVMTEALAAGDQVVVLAATGAPGGASIDLSAVEGDIIPSTNETQDLGSATNRWKDLYLSGNSIDLGGATITASAGAITLPEGSSVGSAPLGGVETFADVDAMVQSTPQNGALGFVSANNRMYMYTGTGWFNIALINANPTITQGGLGNYQLARDGTPTVITLAAEDPEGLPITWSYNAVSLENHATIVQADNVFTITPSTDPAEAGDFTVTFTASDGVNIATDVNVFSLTFLSPLWKYADLSVDSSSTAGLGNSTFIDRSTNTSTVITSGTPTQTAFHPYLDNWSVEFDGSGDYLSLGSDTSYTLGTGDFTIETWVNISSFTQYGHIATTYNGSATAGTWFIRLNNTNQSWQWQNGSDGAATNFNAYNSSTNLTAGQWHHLAVVRESGVVTLYQDGVNVGGGVDIENLVAPALLIGQAINGYPLDGYLSNLRIVKGTALYTSNFNPPTEKLTAVSGTELLTCQSNRFIDNSSNGHTITVGGDPEVSSYNPFGQGSEYVPGENKGSTYFNGSSNITVDDETAAGAIYPADNDFTVSAWFNTPGFSGTGSLFTWGASGVYAPFNIYVNGNGSGINVPISTGGSSWNVNGDVTISAPYNFNEWNHVELTRSGSNFYIFLNGQLIHTVSGSGALMTPTQDITIGKRPTDQPYTGYISDVQYILGEALHTANFTLPTAPVTSANSALYLPMDNAGVFDKTGNNYVSDTTETAYTKYNVTSTRGLTAGMSTGISSTSTWTVEFWWRDPNNNSFGLLNIQNASNQDVLVLDLSVSYGTMFGYRWGLGQPYTGQGTVGPQPPGGYEFADGWFHVAIVGTGGNAYLYHNGTQIGSRSLSGANMSSVGGRIVINSNRYVEGLQLFNGLAKYTSNFTVPNREQGINYQAES